MNYNGQRILNYLRVSRKFRNLTDFLFRGERTSATERFLKDIGTLFKKKTKRILIIPVALLFQNTRDNTFQNRGGHDHVLLKLSGQNYILFCMVFLKKDADRGTKMEKGCKNQITEGTTQGTQVVWDVGNLSKIP